VLKGAPESDRILVRNLGGSVGDVGLDVEGAAEFRRGEQALVLLKRVEGGRFPPWGMKFGKYQILDLGSELIAIGSLPTALGDAQRYDAVSVPLADLRNEITALL